MTSFLLILMILMAHETYGAHVFNTASIHCNSFGVYLNAQKPIMPITEKFLHTFVIQIPILPDIAERPHSECPTHENVSDEAANARRRRRCTNYHYIYEEITALESVLGEYVRDNTNSVHEIIPEADFDSSDRDKRGLINAGGKLLSFLFGTVTADQYETLKTKFDNIQGKMHYTLHKFALSYTKLSSYIWESSMTE